MICTDATSCPATDSCLSIVLCQPEPILGLESRPYIADELLSLLVAPPDPGGVLQQGYQGHQGVICSD